MGMRRKKTTQIKIAVIGAPSVGKSALSVRFLTKRYIGEYDHKLESKYKHEVLIDNEQVVCEILDTCPKTDNDLPNLEKLQWADGLLLVYSITDGKSMTYLRRIRQLITNSPLTARPLYVVANKCDLIHLRAVPAEDGATMAHQFDCGFAEVSAAEQIAPIAVAFQEVCRAVLSARRKCKQSLLERMLTMRTKTPNLKLYVRGKSDSALPKN